jgi:prolipoprotein diacylglyceryltransferase
MAVPAGAAIQPVVPVQLISFAYLAGGGAVFGALYLKNAPAGGRLFAFSALFYSTGRFIIEFWRDDYRVFFAGLSDGQFFSLCFFAAGCIILFRTRKNAKVNSSG